MAIETVGLSSINTYTFKASTKKTQDADTSKEKKETDSAGKTTPVRTTSAWAEEMQKKVSSKQDTTGETKDGQELYTSGKTIGQPTLSKKAADYYETLKKKFSNMNFVLVSEDQKAAAQANASSYASASRQTVLINEDKIEQMARDPEYAKKYEQIIASSSSQLSQIQKDLEAKMGAGVLKGVGMQVGDNGAVSFFATVRDQSKASTEALKKRQEEKKAEAKKAAKQAEKKKAEKKAEEKAAEKRAEESKDADSSQQTDDEFEYIEKNPDSDETGEVTPWDMYGTKTIYASSAEDLYKAIQGYLAGSSVYASGNMVDYEG